MEKLVKNCGECPLNYYDDRYYGNRCILEGPYVTEPTIDLKNEKEIAENFSLKKESLLIKITDS